MSFYSCNLKCSNVVWCIDKILIRSSKNHKYTFFWIQHYVWWCIEVRAGCFWIHNMCLSTFHLLLPGSIHCQADNAVLFVLLPSNLNISIEYISLIVMSQIESVLLVQHANTQNLIIANISLIFLSERDLSNIKVAHTVYVELLEKVWEKHIYTGSLFPWKISHLMIWTTLFQINNLYLYLDQISEWYKP